jgi:hypothetical protein
MAPYWPPSTAPPTPCFSDTSPINQFEAGQMGVAPALSQVSSLKRSGIVQMDEALAYSQPRSLNRYNVGDQIGDGKVGDGEVEAR